VNILFVGKKPRFMTSNKFLHSIRQRYRTKTGGFSGTLDPFAKGVLIIALGDISKLFRFFEKDKKVYRATLWLGADSKSLDIDTEVNIKNINNFDVNYLKEILKSFEKKIKYIPPKYSAKFIDGQRAYNLARDGKEVNLKEIESEIFEIDFINYSHPFLTFDITVSEGSYIRSIGKLIAEKLNTVGILSNLERIREGNFVFNNEEKLDPIKYLQKDFRENRFLRDTKYLFDGSSIRLSNLEIQEIGRYYIKYEHFLAIIEINKNYEVSYLVNRVEVK